MRDEYDFSQSVPNPYLKKLSDPVRVPPEEETIEPSNSDNHDPS
jgi:hypothetical protein